MYSPGLLIVTFFPFPILSQECYDPDGTLLKGYLPCTSGEVSYCCKAGVDTCIGDTLCLSQWGTLWTGGCTDKTWMKAGCPKHCSNYKQEGRTADILPCGNHGVATQWQFCCGNNCCSEENVKLFSIGNATNTLANDRAFIMTSSASSSSSAPLNAYQIACKDSSNGNRREKTRIGLGLGLGLGIPLILAILLWIVTLIAFGIERRMRLRVEKGLPRAPPEARSRKSRREAVEVTQAPPEIAEVDGEVRHELPLWNVSRD